MQSLVIRLGLIIVSCNTILHAQISHASTIDHILRTNTLEVCVRNNALPYSKRDPEPTGFQIDIARKFAELLGVEIKESWISLRWQAKRTKCDLFVGVAKLDGEEDSPYVKKTKPFFRMMSYIVTPAGKPIKSVADLKGKVVAAPSGSIAFYRLRQLDIETVERFVEEDDILNTLISGDANAVVVSNIGLNWFKKSHPDFAVQSTPAAALLEVTLDYDYAVALRKADTETVARFNQMISDMQASGALEKIFLRYGIPYDYVAAK